VVTVMYVVTSELVKRAFFRAGPSDDVRLPGRPLLDRLAA
jgi:hypothetical protein